MPYRSTRATTRGYDEILIASSTGKCIRFAEEEVRAMGREAQGVRSMKIDKDEAVVIESMADGLHVYDDPAGVLTNNPPFPQQLFNLNNYMALSPRQPENRFSGALGLHCYSRGMGALGLPGDLSSASRFVRAAFTRLHSLRARGLYEAERRLQGHGGGERQPVFPHPRRGRAAVRLLRGRARRI